MGSTRDAALSAALAERLRANGLARMVDAVLQLAQPAIRLDLTRVDDEAGLALGVSKVGGAPDLPAATPWPATSDGAPLPFIAQIRLADIAPLDAVGDLPHTGQLSFFYAINQLDGHLRSGDDPTSWRVLWTPDDAPPLARLATPAALNHALDSSFPACAVTFVRRLTLPDAASFAITQLGFTNDERLGYIAVVGGADVGYLPEMDHRLLGYPYQLEPGAFTAAYLAAHGIESPQVGMSEEAQKAQQRAMERLQEQAQQWRPPAEGYNGPLSVIKAIADLASRVDIGDLLRAADVLQPRPSPEALAAQRHHAALDQAAEAEWRLLLQIYSNDEAEMDWAGGGVIHFGIERAALATRDFSRVWVSLQFL
jgi:hypothetical protein